eukprot:6490598-Amphidinium_carterae.2
MSCTSYTFHFDHISFHVDQHNQTVMLQITPLQAPRSPPVCSSASTLTYRMVRVDCTVRRSLHVRIYALAHAQSASYERLHIGWNWSGRLYSRVYSTQRPSRRMIARIIGVGNCILSCTPCVTMPHSSALAM